MFGNGKMFVSHTHDDIAACESVLAALDAWQVDYWFAVSTGGWGRSLRRHTAARGE